MSSHNDHDNHSSEPKKVAFRTPLILGLVTTFIILLAVSTCDDKHGCCEGGKEKCGTSCESKHDEHATEAHGTEAAAPEAVETDEHTAEPAHTH